MEVFFSHRLRYLLIIPPEVQSTTTKTSPTAPLFLTPESSRLFPKQRGLGFSGSWPSLAFSSWWIRRHKGSTLAKNQGPWEQLSQLAATQTQPHVLTHMEHTQLKHLNATPTAPLWIFPISIYNLGDFWLCTPKTALGFPLKLWQKKWESIQDSTLHNGHTGRK